MKSCTQAFCVLLVAALLSGTQGCDLAPQATLVIVGATLIDGTGTDPVEDSVIVINDDRIVAAGPRSDTPFPKGARTIDGRGLWIIPGLIDAHVHFFQSGGLYTRPDVIDLRRRVPYAQELATIKQNLSQTFQRYLCSGVTSVVDVGGPLWNFRVREQAAQTDAAPRVAVAGPLISTYAPEKLQTDDPAIIRVTTPDEARALVRRELEHNPDLVKIWFIRRPGIPLEEQIPLVRAAIEESHAGGVRIAVHATQLATAKAAVRAGADVLVHSVGDKPVDDEFINLLKKGDVLYTSSLVVFEGYAKVLGGQPTLSDFDRTCGDPQVIASWSELPVQMQRRDPSVDFAVLQGNLKRLQQAGVTIAAGTDAGNIGTLHGPALHREFELMAEAGLTPMEILVAATRNAARVVSSKPEMGTIEAGKLADLVLLEADPLTDIRNARKIHAVIKSGRFFDHLELSPPLYDPPPNRPER